MSTTPSTRSGASAPSNSLSMTARRAMSATKRDEHVVAVGELGPRGHVPILEAHHRALRHRVVPSVRDAERHSFRDSIQYSIVDGSYQALVTPGVARTVASITACVEETLRLLLLPADHVPEYFVLEPLE